MKKKSYIAYTHTGWNKDFIKEKAIYHDGFTLPEIFKSKKAFMRRNMTDDPSLIKKIRVTFEEI